MLDNLEKLIRVVYRNWKSVSSVPVYTHPDEEKLVCFLEQRLTEDEVSNLKEHFMHCQDCLELLVTQIRLHHDDDKDVPQYLFEMAKDLIGSQAELSALEIILKLKEKALELLSTTGDVLVGQELMPAAVLRSRSIKDFKDEITILKEFDDIRIEARIENKVASAFTLTIVAKQKQTQELIKDLRVTLLKGEVELESYLSASGSVTFEHVLLGSYKVEISDIKNKLASILLDIKI